MDFKAQGSLEYLLIIAAVIMVSAIVILALPLDTNKIENATNNVNNAYGGLYGAAGIAVSWVDGVISSGDGVISLGADGGGDYNLTKINNIPVNPPVHFRGGGGGSGPVSLPQNVCTCGAAPTAPCVLDLTLEVGGRSITQHLDFDINCLDNSDNSTPWKITNCFGLQAMSMKPGWNYELGNDIDCSATKDWNGGLGFSPVGTSSAPYSGTFDGKSYSIRNLVINHFGLYSPQEGGLFGYSTGFIKNVNFVDANVSAVTPVGIIVGLCQGCTIQNVHASGEVMGKLNVGGIAGATTSSSSLSEVSFTGSGTSTSGNLAGIAANNAGSIQNSFASLTGLYALGPGSAGGLTASQQGSITDSYATGNINAGKDCGGVTASNQGTITNTYFAGAITCAATEAGGVAAFNNGGFINTSYSLGSISASNSHSNGFAGYNLNGSINTVYWDTGISGKNNCFYDSGLGGDSNSGCTSTTNQASDYYTEYGIPFVQLGWDPIIWTAQSGANPKLAWQ